MFYHCSSLFVPQKKFEFLVLSINFDSENSNFFIIGVWTSDLGPKFEVVSSNLLESSIDEFKEEAGLFLIWNLGVQIRVGVTDSWWKREYEVET